MRYRLQRHDGTDCSATMVPITVLRMVPIQRYRHLYNRLQKRNPNKYSEEWCSTRFHTFENLFDCKDVKKIDTSHKSIAEITKEIAHLIYFEDYRPINLNNYMKEYCNGKRDLG